MIGWLPPTATRWRQVDPARSRAFKQTPYCSITRARSSRPFAPACAPWLLSTPSLCRRNRSASPRHTLSSARLCSLPLRCRIIEQIRRISRSTPTPSCTNSLQPRCSRRSATPPAPSLPHIAADLFFDSVVLCCVRSRRHGSRKAPSPCT